MRAFLVPTSQEFCLVILAIFMTAPLSCGVVFASKKLRSPYGPRMWELSKAIFSQIEGANVLIAISRK